MVEQSNRPVRNRCVSHPETHIEHLYTVGRLFGMTAPDFRRCRVLELGCGTGWNLIAMAADYPDGEFLGIDVSAGHIEEGLRHVAALGLGNVTLRATSIPDFAESDPSFDYIVCHGVYSWVDGADREKILDIARDRLSPNGICLVSYDTLPGWSMLQSLRDMISYHCAPLADAGEKAGQARALLDVITAPGSGAPALYSDMVRAEVAFLADPSNADLLSDYLESANHPCYFHEFVEAASKRGLGYLGDSRVPTMFSGNFPPAIACGDVVRREQYTDFIRNRRFRSTLLCRSEIELRREIPFESIDDYHLRGRLAPEGPPPADGSIPDAMTFAGIDSGGTVSSSDKMTTALLLALIRLGDSPVTVETLCGEVASSLGGADGGAVRANLYGNGLPLVLGGHMDLHSDPGRYVATVSERPRASALARHHATFAGTITNGRHEMVALDPVAQALLPHLDGTNDAGDLARHVLARVATGELALNSGDDGTPITDSAEQAEAMAGLVEMSLRSLARRALLQG